MRTPPPFLLSVIGAVLCGSTLVFSADPDPAFYFTFTSTFTLALHKIIAKKAKNLHFSVILNHISHSLSEL
jgi:hypothetical protein